jgi:hypothetical protein
MLLPLIGFATRRLAQVRGRRCRRGCRRRNQPSPDSSFCYSANTTPDPPISLGISFIFGRPSLIHSTVSW